MAAALRSRPTLWQKARYRPGDDVYIRVNGKKESYVVASVSNGKYTLCHENGKPVQGGAVFEERDLELKDPFE
ncbi:hypothetical protein F4861DRAFT_537846 [Xylaria intraflava]|nr:hypothetical protein F4861DRAFT_537846 [Xylaria intraflava]